MAGPENLGKLLLLVSGFLALLGLLFLLAPRVPLLGRLPGDILVQRGRFTLYMPLVTSLLLSLLLTAVLTLVLRLFRG
ncbi:MAG: DUF2905 domain-containing protein [Chloroflexi bacterium]|nr:DUF2905 domain-containing protein [Chloroflexota bacterium]